MSTALRSWLRWRLKAAVVAPRQGGRWLLRIGRSDRASRMCTRVGSASRAAITPGSLTSMHVTNLYVTNQPGAVESRRRREPGPNLIDLDSGVGALAPGGPA